MAPFCAKPFVPLIEQKGRPRPRMSIRARPRGGNEGGREEESGRERRAHRSVETLEKREDGRSLEGDLCEMRDNTRLGESGQFFRRGRNGWKVIDLRFQPKDRRASLFLPPFLSSFY